MSGNGRTKRGSGDGAGVGIDRWATCPPAERIEHREAIVALGVAAIEPLLDRVAMTPALTASACGILERLASSDPGAKTGAVAALRRLATGPDGSYASAALGRLGATSSPRSSGGGGDGTGAARPPSAAQAAVHAALIQAAIEGRTLYYSELGTNRANHGRFLRAIAIEETERGRPPLAALVVNKKTGLPGKGFVEAMTDVGRAHRGEAVEVVWPRVVDEIFAWWATHSDEAPGAA